MKLYLSQSGDPERNISCEKRKQVVDSTHSNMFKPAPTRVKRVSLCRAAED